MSRSACAISTSLARLSRCCSSSNEGTPRSSKATISPSRIIRLAGCRPSTAAIVGYCLLMSLPRRERSVASPSRSVTTARTPSSLGSNSHSSFANASRVSVACIGSSCLGIRDVRFAPGRSCACNGASSMSVGICRPACRSSIVSPEMTEAFCSVRSTPGATLSSRCLIISQEFSDWFVLTSVYEPLSFEPRNVTDSFCASSCSRICRWASSRSSKRRPCSSGE